MAKVLQMVERNRAEKIYRFLNYIIDFLFSVLIIWMILGIIAFVNYFVNGADIDEMLYQIENIHPLIDRAVTVLMYGLIMFLVEKYSNGRSLGKLITGTKVVKTDGSELTSEDLLKRNFSRAVPFDQLSFLGNNGWHDKWSDTRVVNIKKFENAKKLEKEIQTLGTNENF